MSIMVLGTSSHVGKSITVAALCRALRNRNIPVAPFKSQNMSLNSFVTENGAEIGIAQAMQAFAAGIAPTAEMNPVLLKPKGDRTSQVVLLGKPYRDVEIGNYYMETDELLAIALDAYHHLEDEYTNIIVEGAGGAAELNLYDRDIANILLAKSLRLPIVLVGDIERGGIFAQLYGTWILLPEEVRPLVVGFIVNKFRGDPALFEKGVTEIERLTGLPVLGVVPFTNIPLPSEDSLSLQDKKAGEAPVKIAILRLPRISNFTDFELLERHASVTYVQPGTSLQGFDGIILPGTKNTISDLAVLRECGWDQEIEKAHQKGVPIIGICGGYQMLGTRIEDSGTEGEGGVFQGLGLLDISTTFKGYDKTTVQVNRTATGPGPILEGIGTVQGYEIHMGESTFGNHAVPAFGTEGAASEDGMVFGTYLHGLFSNANACNALLEYLCTKKGIPFERIDEETADADYDALAAHFEEHVDIEALLPFFQTPKTP